MIFFASIFYLVFIALALVSLVYLISLWKVYEKSGQEGWKVLIPIYKTYVYIVDIVKRPAWWMIVLFFLPIANIVVYFIISIDLAVKFGKSTGFGIGLALLPFIFIPILAFSDAQYDAGAKNDVLDDLGDIGKQGN
ncbi:MAG: DUF5684 domain-containing protein [Flavobacteriaceae bacterium]|jgi:hypothetical protein|nr:DUF5684 domain-containing protein [Flavobacteriaceae bacterium]